MVYVHRFLGQWLDKKPLFQIKPDYPKSIDYR